jgi:hypothetical protein
MEPATRTKMAADVIGWAAAGLFAGVIAESPDALGVADG